MKNVLLLLVVYLIIPMISFCQDQKEENLMQMLSDDTISDNGVATIYFKRHGILTRDAICHYIIDVGDSLNFNSKVFQNKLSPTENFNYRESENVKRLYLKLNEKTFAVIASFPFLEGLKSINASGLYKYKLKGSLFRYLKSYNVCCLNLESITLNANLLSAVWPGDSFSYDRQAGTVFLQVIFPDGDQFFNQPFKVEAGKKYQVDYYLMPARMEISEMK